jgi:hypothetical protein
MVREQVNPAVTAPPPSVIASSANMEIATATFDANSNDGEIRVGLKRQWRAVDVYVSLERAFAVPAQALGLISAFVFARTGQSGQTLVGTGRMRPFSALGSLAAPSPKLIAGARLEASLFTAHVTSRAQNATGAPKCSVTLVGTNNTAEFPEKTAGAVPAFGGLWNTTPPRFGQGQILSAVVTNPTAAVTFVQFFDTANVPALGDVPIASWAVPANSTITLDPFPFGRTVSGPVLIESSTAPTFTAAAGNLVIAGLLR